MLGTQTRGGRMEGADESTELWRYTKTCAGSWKNWQNSATWFLHSACCHFFQKGQLKYSLIESTSINILESERKRLGASYKNVLERRQASRLGVGRPKSHVVVDVYRRRRRRRRRQKSLEWKLKVEDRKDDEQIRRQYELENKEARKRRKRWWATNSVTRLGDLLDFGQVFKAFGNN